MHRNSIPLKWVNDGWLYCRCSNWTTIHPFKSLRKRRPQIEIIHMHTYIIQMAKMQSIPICEMLFYLLHNWQMANGICNRYDFVGNPIERILKSNEITWVFNVKQKVLKITWHHIKLFNCSPVCGGQGWGGLGSIESHWQVSSKKVRRRGARMREGGWSDSSGFYDFYCVF